MPLTLTFALLLQAYVKHGQSTAPSGSLFRDDGILNPSRMIYVQLPTKMPSRRRPLKPKLEEKESKNGGKERYLKMIYIVFSFNPLYTNCCRYTSRARNNNEET